MKWFALLISLTPSPLLACPFCSTNLGGSTVYRWPTLLLILIPLIMLGILGWWLHRLLRRPAEKDHPTG